MHETMRAALTARSVLTRSTQKLYAVPLVVPFR